VHGRRWLGYSKDSQNKPLALELIKELTSKETIPATAEAGVAIPARRSVAEGADFLKFPTTPRSSTAACKTASRGGAGQFQRVETIFMRYMATS